MAILDEWQARESALGDVHTALAARGVIVPLELGGRDESSWADCDLASFAENRLGELRDPDGLDPQTRERWLAGALDPAERWVMPRARKSEACYWIENEGRRVGTLAISRFCLGNSVGAHSVYLRPRYRSRGIMEDTLSAVCGELEERDLGLRLETCWTWQRAVRFYLRTGFWLRSWKRDLAFDRYPHAPAPVITVGDTDATVAVEVAGRMTVLARARHDGRSLIDHDEEPGLPDTFGALVYDARTTLALVIALAGWPLIRSQYHWTLSRTSDLVYPEALADRIRSWEAWAGLHGWQVPTPRIPDLEYPSWAELEATWK
jgi:GNAT superfamily N-acetyltransferase